MKPVDPRLVRYARATRVFLLASVVLGLAGALLVVAQAVLIASVVVAGFEDGASLGSLRGELLLLALVAVGRAVVAWLTELAAHRSAAAVKSELRLRVVSRAAELGPGWLAGQRTGELATLVTRGVDALDDYFAKYLPQLGLAVVVPAAVLGRMVFDDWVSAAIVAGTLPLVPLFMVLIGWATEAATGRQFALLSRLSGHFLDVVAGLPTLKVFGRSKAQAEKIREITGEYRRATLRTLRVAFLSSFALELLSTISVALVAVSIGMRLVDGELSLYTGLVVLILAPEAYLPLRQVGAHYHAAAEGVAAAERVFEVLSAPAAAVPFSSADDAVVRLSGVSVRYPGREAFALPSFSVGRGEVVALAGPSGGGKSTVLGAVLGFVAPASGVVSVGAGDLAGWHRQVAWVPQRPYLFAGSVADNVRLAAPDASPSAVRSALASAGGADLDPGRSVGEDGAGLSAGQRQRVALARAFLADRPVLLLDEPTASLDGDTEASVVAAVRRLAVGRTVLLVAHRAALLAVADRVVRCDAGAPFVASAGPAFAPAAPAPAPSARDIAHPRPPVTVRGVTVAGGVTVADGDIPARPAFEDFARSVKRAAGAGATPAAGDTQPPTARSARRAAGAAEPPAEGVGHGTGRAGGNRTPRRATPTPVTARLTLAGTLGALALLSAVGLMATSGWLISRASEHPPILYLMIAVTATRAFGISRATLRYVERLISHDAVLRLLAELRATVYRQLDRITPAGLKERHRGDLLTRLVTDVDAQQDHYLRWLLPAAEAAAVAAAATAFTAWLDPTAGAALAAGLLTAGAVAPLLTTRMAARTTERLAPDRARLTVQTVDLLRGTAELTVTGALPRRTAALTRTDKRLRDAAARDAAAQGAGAALTALACGLTIVATTAAGVAAVHAGRLDGVWLAAVALVPLAAFEAVTVMPQALTYRARARRSADRIAEVTDAPTPASQGAGSPPADPFPLTLRGVGARYPGAAAPALRGVDLTLPRGHRLAVVGPSGAGKTTLAHVLLRFLDAEDGTYSLGPYDADEVRRIVGLCAQDAHLFDSTLRENLRLARPGADDAALWQALADARLADWAAALPEGLDTVVGEGAVRLSGGQRRRVALARALLADFEVLILDEPAEHLDLPTADALTADLLAATAGRTTVLITHRLTGLDQVDEIVVLDAGRIVQRGTFGELSAQDGPFRRTLEREAALQPA
ncbi:Vitamin B12 import ATP-binding protein BtuD [Streptomyces sp. RB5]|uniref:Vitamin B12 import ATP-binding protein BtuD n=1 Tax=Streptomyces smaragdinus TaxID=2585196 RepID=A0A7K0CH35_9ACTN|nr:thiol reductant ABC exporter subunit CydD [Streptomyces smaragdinus]MQY12791.1 Vitamin B12 import ATP-binding protein BtuD [Streptomyces smaragdinus]